MSIHKFLPKSQWVKDNIVRIHYQKKTVLLVVDKNTGDLAV